MLPTGYPPKQRGILDGGGAVFLGAGDAPAVRGGSTDADISCAAMYLYCGEHMSSTGAGSAVFIFFVALVSSTAMTRTLASGLVIYNMVQVWFSYFYTGECYLVALTS
jgi:hypothetical protein